MSLTERAPDGNRLLEHVRRVVEVPLTLRDIAEVVHELGNPMLILGRLGKRHPPLKDAARGCRPTLQMLEKSKVAEQPRQTDPVARGLQKHVTLFEQGARFDIAAFDEFLTSRAVEQRGKYPAIVDLPRDGDALP